MQESLIEESSRGIIEFIRFFFSFVVMTCLKQFSTTFLDIPMMFVLFDTIPNRQLHVQS